MSKLTWLIWFMWLLFLLSRTAEGGQMSSERLVYTPQHYTLCNTRSCRLGKVIKDSTGDHSLSVCDLLRKMVLARAWSEGLDSMASSGTQEEILF